MKKVWRSCLCETAATSEPEPESGPGASGFCGVCQRCVAPGHGSYYPGPVAGLGAWCDRCYLIERHTNREPGAFFFSPGACIRDDGEQYEIAAPLRSSDVARLATLVGRIEGQGSRLLVTFRPGAGVDFWLRDDGRLEMSFADASRGLWGSCTISPPQGALALEAAAAGQDLRDVLGRLKIDADYFARNDDSENLTAAGDAVTPADSAPQPPDSGSPELAPEHESLWKTFLAELRGDQDWDHDFIPSPYSPDGALRAFVERAGDAAAPTLVGAISSEDEARTYWACVGLRWLGPRAGHAAAAALEARLWGARGRAEPYLPAAVALEAVDSGRARRAGAQRNPLALYHLMIFHLERGLEASCEFIEWVFDREDAATIEAMLDHRELRDAAIERCPSRLAERLRQLMQTHAADGVRAAAANLLAELRVEEPASKLIEALARCGRVNVGALERLAAHPDSEHLLNLILAQRNLYLLSELLRRRRCAGCQTDAWPARALLREKLERPERVWPTEQHEVHQAALCAAELRDTELLDSLVNAVLLENTGYAWDALVRALRALGRPATEALRREFAACPPGERRKPLEWMLARVESPGASVRELLDLADVIFLEGRIEPTVWGAFRAYGDILLAGPSAHAAFQLAWIDRAFGAEVVQGRVSWIRELGFYDEEMLAELARPLGSPLEGYRSRWDGGELQKHDPDRAARAAKAGLPSLAAHWSREGHYESAALEQMERVWQAVAPRL